MSICQIEVWNTFSVPGDRCKEELREHDGYKDRAHYEKSRAPAMGKSGVTSIQHTTQKGEFGSITIPREVISHDEVVTCYCNQIFNFYIDFSFFNARSSVPF